MKLLADDCIWQYFSVLGRSGTKKITMCNVMPKLMDLVLLTPVKLPKVDPIEARSALSTYLKNTSTKVAARKHKIKINGTGISAFKEGVDRSENGQVEEGSFLQSKENEDYVLSPAEITSESEWSLSIYNAYVCWSHYAKCAKSMKLHILNDAKRMTFRMRVGAIGML